MFTYVVGIYSRFSVESFQVVRAKDAKGAIDLAAELAFILFPKNYKKMTYMILRSDAPK